MTGALLEQKWRDENESGVNARGGGDGRWGGGGGGGGPLKEKVDGISED